MIKKNESITIEKVGNGFMIRPELRQPGVMSSLDDMTVFNTLPQLTKFIKAHFAEKEEGL
jgi:hypothetical protein